MNVAEREGSGRRIPRFLGTRAGCWALWLVVALWVLPHPARAAFDSTAAATISWFYAAAFGRTPIPNSTLPDYGDLSGLAFWTEAYRTGADGLAPYRGDVYAIADFFVTSTEFQAQYPAALTDAAFVTALYENMLGRAPDSVGLAFWVGQLSAGASRGTVLADFTNSEENRTSDPLRQAALASFIAALAAHDGGVTPAEAAEWLAQNPTLDGARVDGAAAPQLTVVPAGTGTGTVTSDPPGIACGAVCTATFPPGVALVTLTATPHAGATFAGWSGACTGAHCILKLGTAPQTVTAAFAAPAASALRVDLEPPEAVEAGTRWRRTGAAPWFEGGATETDLPPGEYRVEFAAAPGWTAPAPASVPITAGETATLTAAYTPAAPPPPRHRTASLHMGEGTNYCFWLSGQG